MIRSTRIHARAAAVVALAVLANMGSVPAQALEKPRRRPDGGGYFMVHARILSSALDPALAGTDAKGTLWFERLMGKKLRGSSGVVVKPGSGPLGDFAVELDADLDPAGIEESFDPTSVGGLLLGRALATSDLAFVPVRACVPHLTHFESRSRVATKEVKVAGSTQEMHEVDLATPPLHAEQTECYFTRTIRRFQPSGFEVHDYVLTLKKKPDEYLLGSRALRMLVHPSANDATGHHPEGGVFQVTLFDLRQLDFRDDALMLDDKEQAKIDDRFQEKLLDALFEAMQTEGLGNPFDSPAAVAARASGLLDSRALTRLCNIGNPRALAAVAPLVAAKKFEFAPDAYLKAWSEADDPAERLLLAAGAAAGGAKNPSFAKEAKLALESDDRLTLRAALVLAEALKDPALTAQAKTRLGG